MENEDVDTATTWQNASGMHSIELDDSGAGLIAAPSARMPDKRIGLGRAAGLEAGAVPANGLTAAVGDVAQQHSLG